MHQCNVEETLHFTCNTCKGCWSIATSEYYHPRNLRCPHCSEANTIQYDQLPPGNVVKDTGTVKGRGVYAGRRYRKDEVVEISPVIVFEAEYDTLPNSINCVIYDWDGREDVTTNALALGHGSLFNHANPANMRCDYQCDKKQIVYVAVDDIAKDEELTINYNSEHGEPVSTEDTWFEEMKIKPI